MYNYPFKENGEYVLSEYDSIQNSFGINLPVNVLLTNKNILVFYDSDADNILKSQAVCTMPQYEVLCKLALDNLDYSLKNDNTILNIDDNSFVLYDFNLKDFIEKDD